MGLESYGESPGFVRFELQALGTDNVLLLLANDSAEARACAQEAFDSLERLEQSLSKFLPQSDVSLLNSLGASRPVRLSREVVKLLALSREAWELTGGAFDPTVGELMRAWGFVDMEGRVPGDAELAALRERCGMRWVELDLDQSTARLSRNGVSIDLGAIGKGYAVDFVASRAQARGFGTGLFVSGRSSIAAWGTPPDGSGWRFDVVHPLDEEAQLAEIEVEAGSLSTSGAYTRRFVQGWKEYGHVLDPRTGQPASGLKSVTVWTRSALLGDVLSTALFVLGLEGLASNGPVERLTRAWTPDGEEPRASVLYAVEDPGLWGGLRIGTFHLGRPGFKLLSSQVSKE